MGKYKVVLTIIAQKHLAKHKKSGNKSSIKRIEIIFKELSETPFDGIGQPKALKENLAGFWSRRINQKDRIIYTVDENTVIVDVISAIGHYLDK